jgi:CRP/FNR family transcriptional regulator
MPQARLLPEEPTPVPNQQADPPRSRQLNQEFARQLRPRLVMACYAAKPAPAGQVLARSGERVVRLPLIESGQIDAVLHVGDQGNQVIPVSFLPGELALVSTLFSEQPSHVDMVAATDLSARWIPITDIEQCLLQSPDLLVLAVRFLAQRLREAQSRERGWLERGVQERVCAVVSRLLRDGAAQADGRLLIAVTHDKLAAHCGLSRPKLSQELKRLELAGTLRLHRGTIEILDRSAFALAV